MKTLSLLLILMQLQYRMPAQADPKPFRCWLAPGVSMGFSGKMSTLPGYKISFEASSQKRFFYALHHRGSANLEGIDGGEFRENTITDLEEYGALAGLGKYLTDQLALVVMTGISYSAGIYRGQATGRKSQGWPVFSASNADEEFEYHNFKEYGVPVHGRMIFAPTEHLGLSLDLFYNFQTHASYGLNLSLLAGWIR